jgi:pyridoxamine 5'-phosphate oxidase
MTRSPSDLPGLRRDYPGTLLGESQAAPDPFQQFDRWFDEIRTLERDPTAMALATATRDGRPSARMVLLKGLDRRGFVFFTNYRSRKGQEIGQTRHASLLFYWASLDRQVRVEGLVSAVSSEESDAYFALRPLESRWSAIASPQSEPIDSREALEAAVAGVRERHGDTVPRPDWWGGYRVAPSRFEFWQGRPNRLHDRLSYRPAGERWAIERLAP